MVKALIVIALSCVLFRLGGWGRVPFLGFMNAKWWRWLALPYLIAGAYHNIIALVLFYIATNISYGENSPLNVIGRDAKWLVYGACFGLASFPILGMWALAQAVSGAIGFWGLMKLSNDGINGKKLDHAIVEICFPIFGLCMLLFIK